MKERSEEEERRGGEKRSEGEEKRRGEKRWREEGGGSRIGIHGRPRAKHGSPWEEIHFEHATVLAYGACRNTKTTSKIPIRAPAE